MIHQIDEFIAGEKKTNANLNGTSGKKSTRKLKQTDDETPALSPIANEYVYFYESPSYIKGGEMRSYQIEGLNWLISLYHNNINGILADEMGLGKTLQTISLLGYLQEFLHIAGPHLLLVPKSTLHNWLSELNKWLPSANAFILHGDASERKTLIKERLLSANFDICITSYEICLIEKNFLGKINWQYLIIDEAHRIKNENSILSQIIRIFHSEHRLLLTGTPLQNNLHELWALLNFLLPDVFRSGEDFDEWFKEHEGEQDDLVKKFRHLLQPFLLRRLKTDVEHSLLPKKEIYLYVKMTDVQKSWYQKILQKDAFALNELTGKTESKTRLMNIAMQLKKCCNHPYLFEGAEPGPPYTNDFHLVASSGKMILLDKLLTKLKANGSRVLLFSQMSRMLDIFEDYCDYRDWDYCRIDGSTSHEDRIAAIDEYNKPDSSKFLFLLTTRAGGLGINLVTADVVIIFDSDWNPQVDLQAQDRAHRIGQTKQVYVFRFVIEDSLEEKILERALQKLRLDQLVIQKGKAPSSHKQVNSGELMEMIRHGAQNVIDSNMTCAVNSQVDQESAYASFDIEQVMKTGEEKTSKLQEKYSHLGLDDLQKFSTISTEDSSIPSKRYSPLIFPIELSKRERKAPSQYSVDSYYREVLSSSATTTAAKKLSLPPKPKFPILHDYQFFNQKRLECLFEKETLFFQKSQSYQLPSLEDEDAENEGKSASRLNQQLAIDNAEPLTENEILEKERLLNEGFSNWNRRDFFSFIRALEKYGRNANHQLVCKEVEGKTKDEIEAYSQIFWKRYKELADWQKYISQIEKGEQKIERANQINKIIRKKVSVECGKNGTNWNLLKLNSKSFEHFYSASATTGWFTEEEDKFIIWAIAKYGYQSHSSPTDTSDVWEQIRIDLRNESFFKFDWFIHTRSGNEIQKRCATFVAVLEKDRTELSAKKALNNSNVSNTENLKKNSSQNYKTASKPLTIDNLLNNSKSNDKISTKSH